MLGLEQGIAGAAGPRVKKLQLSAERLGGSRRREGDRAQISEREDAGDDAGQCTATRTARGVGACLEGRRRGRRRQRRGVGRRGDVSGRRTSSWTTAAMSRTATTTAAAAAAGGGGEMEMERAGGGADGVSQVARRIPPHTSSVVLSPLSACTGPLPPPLRPPRPPRPPPRRPRRPRHRRPPRAPASSPMATKLFSSATDADDPLAQVLQPPPDESPDDRAARLLQQQEAQRVSHQIDEDIQESKKAFDRRKKAIKVLLLGQAESGKSTTLKNFQLAFSPTHFRNERIAWRTIIQLNLIRSIKRLLEVMQTEWDSSVAAPPKPDLKGKSVAGRAPPTVRFSTSPLTDSHRRIRMRLSPLITIEEDLTRRLFPEASDKVQDVCVRAGSGWKGVLAAMSTNHPPEVQPQPNGKHPARPTTARKVDPTTVLAACREDIVTLWEDPVVRSVLKKQNVRLQDMPGFFLNDAARIATVNYEPTDDDIVRARLRTLGVEEHKFTMESGAIPGSEWYIYDVGGSRSMRPHWIPYFDDVHAIIFLAPLTFNLMLEEDARVNRLEDSITLWRSICSNVLLAKTTIILFLNKMDILQATLAAGIRVSKFVPSYGDQPNDIQHVTRYFRDKFRGYHKRLSPQSRPFFWHETSVIDTRATAAILVGVREGILRAHLQSVNVI